MALLDFQEIPEAGKSSGQQDTFELFARDVLECWGFKVLQGPARGADGGKDLVVEETREGVIESTKLKWLVSCKHFAFSGKSVRPDDEKNVFERVSAAGCNGFLGFYSTLPSAGLSELLHRQSAVQVKLFDHAEIERRLLDTREGRHLAERYFPNSVKKLKHTPAKIFDQPLAIECDYCGKNLLEPPSGIWVLWHADAKTGDGKHTERFVDVHFACKGKCDKIMEDRIRNRHASLGFIYDAWDDIPDMAIPTVFITKVMAFFNGLVGGDQYEPEAFNKVKRLLLATFPLVSRHQNDQDQQELEHLQSIPSYLGGMGYER
jgi:hypothetical protein